MSLYKKMHMVMVESESITKDMQVGDGNYKYKAVSEAEVLNSIKPLFKKHGLIMFPIEVITEEMSDSYETTFKGKTETKNRMLTKLSAKYKIVDVETGEFEILATVGNGADTQDKGSGKAMTYALKSLLQKTFLLFSGEDTDNTHSRDIDNEQTSRKMIQPDQLNFITDLLAAIGDKELEQKMLKGYGVKDIDELDFKQASGAVKRLQEIAEEK